MKMHNEHPLKMTELTSSQKCIAWRLQLFDIFSPEHEIKWTKARSINTWQENISQMKKKSVYLVVNPMKYSRGIIVSRISI